MLRPRFFQILSQKFNSLSKDQSEEQRTFGSEVNQIVVGIMQNYWEQLIGIGSLLISILCFFFAIYVFAYFNSAQHHYSIKIPYFCNS